MAETINKDGVGKVIDVLNQARSMELLAISQYMNQHYNLDSYDYGEFASNVKLVAIDEMRHAEMFAERIKELGGEPTTDPVSKTVKGQKVKEVFVYDKDLEERTIQAYNKFLLICREHGDAISAKLFEAVIVEEQIHANYFSSINGHIEQLGDVYLSKIAGTAGAPSQPVQGFVAKP